MRHKRKTTISIVLVLIFVPMTSFALFGIGSAAGNAAMIPYLKQQIAQLRSQLRTANQTLGYIKGAQRGFNRVRRYGMNDVKNDYLLSNPDFSIIRGELYTMKEGGDYTEINPRDLDRKIRKIYKPNKEKTVPEARRSLFASNIAHKNMKTAMLMRSKTSKQVFQDGRRVSNASKNALSPAESARVTADGVGLMVQTQADQMLLLSNINQNSAADLQIAAIQERQSIESDVMDQQTLNNLKNSVKPIR